METYSVEDLDSELITRSPCFLPSLSYEHQNSTSSRKVSTASSSPQSSFTHVFGDVSLLLQASTPEKSSSVTLSDLSGLDMTGNDSNMSLDKLFASISNMTIGSDISVLAQV